MPYSNGHDVRYEHVKAVLRKRFGASAICTKTKKRLKVGRSISPFPPRNSLALFPLPLLLPFLSLIFCYDISPLRSSPLFYAPLLSFFAPLLSSPNISVSVYIRALQQYLVALPLFLFLSFYGPSLFSS